MKGILFLTVLFLSIGPVGGALSEYDIIIVRSDLPYDWTVAQAYSHRAQIPIITTSPESLDQSAQEQLGSFREMGYNSILVFGGEEAVSQNVEAELVSQGFVTHRIREVDRYGTSARVAIELYERADTVVLVNAENIKSLLNSQIAALQTDAPILFIKDDEIPLSVKESFRQLEVKKIILIPSDISDQVKSELLSDFELKIFSPGAAGDLELKNLKNILARCCRRPGVKKSENI
jgi:putative cell wall-binding protein